VSYEPFLGTITKEMGKTTISFLKSAHPFDWMEQFVSCCMDFCEILCWGKSKIHPVTCPEDTEEE
jgi:hypothetical protein